jgi:hypothetical protein
LVRVDSGATAREFRERGATSVVYPDAIEAGRLRTRLQTLLAEGITRENRAGLEG